MEAEYRDTQHPLRGMAARDVRGATTDEEYAHLRDPDVLDHWLDALHDLITDLTAQFQERKAKLEDKRNECMSRGEQGRRDFYEASAQYLAWKAGAIRFKGGVENRMREAKNLRHEHIREVCGNTTAQNEVLGEIVSRLDTIEDKLDEKLEKQAEEGC